MIEESARQFAVPGELQRRFFLLDQPHRLRCSLMYLMGAMGCATDSDCGLEDPIVAAFLGYAARDRKGQLRVFGFDSFEPMLRSALIETITEAAARKSDITPTPIWRWRCCNDITIVASLAAQHLLIKKRSGKLGVAILQLIKKVIHTGEMHKSDDIDFLSRTIIGYCLSRRLLVEDEVEYQLRPDAVFDWLAATLDERIQEITAWVITNCGGWNSDLLRRLCDAAATQWIVLSMFPESDHAKVREVLLSLQFAGMLDVRRHGPEILFQHACIGTFKPGGAEHPVVIMPDFTIVIPQECLPESLFAFARFCKINSLDRVYHGNIEKNVLTEALSGGMEGDRIIGVLEQWKAPANVIESVREWIREFNRLSLSTENVLITADGRVAQQIAAYEQLQPWLEQVPAHSVFRIKPGSERIVRDIVRRLGFDERMPRMAPMGDADTTPTDLFQTDMEETRWSLIVENEPHTEKAPTAIRGSKYGAELKTLELSEVVQVIDYAILTSQRVVFSYEGSPYVRKGIYTLTPILCSKGVEPMLDGELQRTGSRKQFYVRKINAIGVVPQ